MSRRYRQYTRASEVTVRDAETGEVLERQDAYDPIRHKNIVASGNHTTNPAARANKRRGYANDN